MQTKFKILMVWAMIFYGSSVNGQTTFQNPVIGGMNPDPSICRVGDDYYLVTSTFEYFPGLPIYHSKDLVHWKLIGYALSRKTNCPLLGCESATGGNYAPTLRYHNGTFYVACTNYGGQGSQGQFYVTATDPAGPWSEPIWVGNWYVDPSISFVNDTMYYLSPNNADGFLLGIMNPATGKYIVPLKKIALGTGGVAPEGPHLYKIDDYYYLMSAEGGTGYQHMEVIQRSQSPWGPFEVSPINPVLSNKDVPDHPIQAIGHADLIQLQDSSWWAVCLGFRPKGGTYHHLGRETFLAPITWDEEGWPKAGADGIVEEEYPIPDLPAHIWETEPIRDDFDNDTLHLPWNFIRNPHVEDWSLTGNQGYLRLNGSKISFKEKDSPAFIGRRQSSFNIVASAKVSFTPADTNEEAGLVVRGDDKNHYDLLITLFAGKRVVMLRQILGDITTNLNYREIPDGDIILHISATDLEYRFWVQQEGHTAELIGTALTKDLSTEKIGGFTGVFIGMYASGNGAGNTNPADFDWFDYEEEPALPYEWSVGPGDSLNNMISPRIISAISTYYDKATIVWDNIVNATCYIIERYNENRFDSIGITDASDTVFTDSGLTGSTLYLYRIVGKNDKGYSYPSTATSVFTLHEPGAFSGTPAQIPGKIEAENYDFGIANEAYHDNDEGNTGGKYRTGDVDIETCFDTGNGYNIGWINNGEWALYTVDINDTLADIEFRVASVYGGSIKLELDGVKIANTNISATGGWQTWKTVSLSNVKMEKGENKKLKVVFVTGGFNLNWINFIKVEQSAIQDSKDEGINIYPNPVKNYFQVSNIEYNISSVEIFSITGEMVNSSQASNNSIIDISELSSGVYLVKIYIRDQAAKFFRLVKT